MKAALLKLKGNNPSQRRHEFNFCSTQKTLGSEHFRAAAVEQLCHDLPAHFKKKGSFVLWAWLT
jgi:hypothetical protein